jgi:hypothetical protein
MGIIMQISQIGVQYISRQDRADRSISDPIANHRRLAYNFRYVKKWKYSFTRKLLKYESNGILIRFSEIWTLSTVT